MAYKAAEMYIVSEDGASQISHCTLHMAGKVREGGLTECLRMVPHKSPTIHYIWLAR